MAHQNTQPQELAGALSGPVAVLADELLTRYLDWRADANATASAYRHWSHAAAGADAEAVRFAAYLAALDQEETAASAYARIVTDVRRALRREQRRAPGRAGR